MPRRRTQTRDQVRETVQRPAEIDTDTGEILTDGEAETIERLNAALSDNAGAHVWLIRVNEVFKTPEGWKEGWAFNADIGEINELRERIARECGPGRYRCRVLRDSLPFKQYDLEIRMTMAQRRQIGQAPAPALAPAAPAPGGDLLQMMAAAIANQNRMLEALLQRPAGPTMGDMLQQMKTMQELMPKPPESDIGFKMFMQAFELSQKIQGDRPAPEGSNVFDLVRDTLQQLPTLLQALPKAPGAAPPALAHNPPPFNIAPPATISRPTTDQGARAPGGDQAGHLGGIPDQAAQLAQAETLKTYLLAEAAKGTDPEMCADWAADNMPAQLWMALGQAPDPLALVLQVIPEAAPHRAWFAKLIDCFFEDDETAGPQPGPANAQPPANRTN